MYRPDHQITDRPITGTRQATSSGSQSLRVSAIRLRSVWSGRKRHEPRLSSSEAQRVFFLKRCIFVVIPRGVCVPATTGKVSRHVWRWELAALLLLATATVTLATKLPKDFVLYNTLEDGELETRIRVGNVTAKEVTVGRGLVLKFRQLSIGHHFIQLIYSAGSISDCDYVHDASSVTEFLDSFSRDVHELTTVYNASVVPLESGVMPQEMARWMDYRKLKEMCKKMHQDVRKTLRERQRKEEEMKKESNRHRHPHNDVPQVSPDSEEAPRSKRALTDYLLFPGTLWCGASDAASRYQDLGPMSGTDKCCRRHDNCKLNIPGFGKRYGLFNARPFTISQCWCDRSWPQSSSRSRRDLTSYLRVPGTKWCGKGRSASKYTDVGMFSSTDKCCRRHDSACPFWIAGFDTKYGLFNWRVNTIMHCQCDERFRTCLKRVGTSDANLVGKLFFNVVQTKCFVFKTKKTCVERSWWGKCQKKKRLKQAILRDNMPY